MSQLARVGVAQKPWSCCFSASDSHAAHIQPPGSLPLSVLRVLRAESLQRSTVRELLWKGQGARASPHSPGESLGWYGRWPGARVTSLSSAHPLLAEGALWREEPEQRGHAGPSGLLLGQSRGGAWPVAVLTCGGSTVRDAGSQLRSIWRFPLLLPWKRYKCLEKLWLFSIAFFWYLLRGERDRGVGEGQRLLAALVWTTLRM